jgi:hypothetical protein
MNRLMKWPLLCGLLALALARAALAADALYENDGIVNYSGSFNFSPQIDATNFVNNNSFTMNFTTASLTQPFYETSDTVNYTNNGSMVVNTGFIFDTQSTSTGFHTMAGNFINPGEVDCGYQFLAWATNIVNPGTVNVPGVFTIVNSGTLATGVAALLQFTGQNVDLSRSTLTIAGGQGSAQAVGLLGLTGADTNSDWDASFDLGPTYAFPAWPVSFLPAPPFGFGFPNLPLNTTPYFNFAAPATNLLIIRTVFLQDNSPNVSHNVYFDSAGFVGGGNATVEWAGSYVDPATGNPATNYLYLNNNYLQSVATNDPSINGIPLNFTFTENPTPLFLGTPTAPGFFNVFDSGFVSNRFAYVSAQLIATSAGTNSIPNHSITNLPARIQINASRELNLELAQITQPDYLSLQATNQFDGNAGARIAAPFSDINLGVTNGFLTITNLQPQSFPVWGGTVQAWSTRWLALATNSSIVVDTNGVATTNSFTVTNDFRVMIVASQLTPTTLAQVQDLILHGTNSIVISDAFNVMRTFTADAQNLTLTTNGAGVGATSLDGELNLGSSSIFWQSSIPNLRNLTNNGAIRTLNQANFGSSAQPYFNFINNSLVSDQGAIIYANNFVSSGTILNGVGSFALQSLTTTLTNGSITAGGDISITASSLVTSNLVLQAGRSLTLQVTNLLTDGVTNGTSGLTNGNIWSVGAASIGAGLNLPIKPALGDLLGTTITNIAPTNKNVINIWAGVDRGSSNSGYTNNAAVGQLILDALGASPGTQFYFGGTGASNAIYVDYLELQDRATNRDVNGNVSALVFNTNLVIYYAQAVINGSSVAEKLNHKNSNHLRWVPTYAGYFSSTNIVNPDGTTNTVNAALAQSTTIDSDGDGIVNANDPTPFFVSGNVNFTATLTNVPPLKVRLQWQTMPDATNYVFYKTNLLAANWLVLTNFITPPAPPYAPITTNVLDSVNPAVQKFYRVRVDPNSTDFYGP